MKRKIFYILAAAFGAAILFTSCGPEGPDTPVITPEQEAFMAQSTFGVFSGSTDQLNYSDANGQYALGDSDLSVRLQLDDMSRYVSLLFSAEPEKDKDVAATLSTNLSSLTGGEITLRVLKLEQGKLWLWDPASNRGYLTPWK